MSDTLLLDTARWDLVLDAYGNIALASAPYAQAQDAATAIRTFRGECWYNQALGIPYFTAILGQMPSPSFLKAQFVAAALTVPGVVSAVAYLTGIVGRRLSGQIQITNSAGVTLPINF